MYRSARPSRTFFISPIFCLPFAHARHPHRSERPRTRPNAGLPVLRGAESTKVTSSSSTAPKPITTQERSLLRFMTILTAPTRTLSSFNTTLQDVKSALYDKDYARAFGSEDFRLVYAARWVPARAVIYRRIFSECDIGKKLVGVEAGVDKDEEDDNAGEESSDDKTVAKVLMLGGGAGSEVIGLASMLDRVAETGGWTEGKKVEVVVVDQSDWSSVLAAQETALLTHYTNLSSRLSISFTQSDILTPSTFTSLPYSSSKLITLLFTISELFLQSRPQTLALLSHITSSTKRGTVLLVVESASLALIPIGTSGRTYPLGTLLDHALTQDKGREEDQRAKWKALREQESTWYRMPEGAADCYPLGLENSRVVLRLYQRV